MAENAALFLPSVSEKSKHTFCLLPNLQSALHFSTPLKNNPLDLPLFFTI